MKKIIIVVVASLALVSCGDDINPGSVDAGLAGDTFAIGGSVSGLTSGSVVLQNNGGDDLTVSTNGSFVFATEVASGSAYSVTVLTQPVNHSCSVSMEAGTVSAAVNNISVTCIEVFTVGGTLTDLASGQVVLQNNGADDLVLTANGAFQFATPVSAAYSVTVLSTTSGQLCEVIANGSGTASAVVSNVEVVCRSRIIFSTVGVYDGAMGGMAGADALCEADAGKPNMSTYKALLVDGVSRIACTTANCSGGAEGTDWVLLPSTLYQRADGTAIDTTNASGIFTFPLSNPLTTQTTTLNLWTGMNNDWTVFSSNCLGWTTSAAGEFGRVGQSNTAMGVGSGTISLFGISCSSSVTLLCVEQ